MDSLRAYKDIQRQTPVRQEGFSLIELLVVLLLLGLAGTLGIPTMLTALERQEARGAAQAWQVAAARAQVGSLWQGGTVQLTYEEGVLSLSFADDSLGGPDSVESPLVPVTVNLPRWLRGNGVRVSFSGTLASPDGGGSLYFSFPGGSYRVAIRPETGFTVRSGVFE